MLTANYLVAGSGLYPTKAAYRLHKTTGRIVLVYPHRIRVGQMIQQGRIFSFISLFLIDKKYRRPIRLLTAIPTRWLDASNAMQLGAGWSTVTYLVIDQYQYRCRSTCRHWISRGTYIHNNPVCGVCFCTQGSLRFFSSSFHPTMQSLT